MRLTVAVGFYLSVSVVPVRAQRSDSVSSQSRDGRVAFIRRTPDRLVATSLGEQDATELWISNADGTNSRMLVRGAAAPTVEHAIAAMSDPVFSPDGKRIYFLSSAWVTSDAVHAVDIATGREWFVAPGNSLDVIPQGPFAGCLLVGQHRYRAKEGGSYDWLWLLDGRGKEIALAAKESAADESRVATWMSGKIPRGAFSASRGKLPTAHCR